MAAFLVAGSACVLVAPPMPVAAAPGAPEVTSPGVPIYSEDFSNASAAGAPIRIGSYTGGTAAGGLSYTADAAWSPGASACNGWILRSGTPIPLNGGTPPVTNNDRCTEGAFGRLRGMAAAMGEYQGMTTTEAAANQVLSSYTNSVTGAAQPAGTVLSSASTIATVPGHFYAVSAIFGAVNCQAAHPRLTFDLLVNGTASTLATGLDPCTDPSAQVINNVSVAKLQSGAIQMPVGAVSLVGIRLRNTQATGEGNDAAFDLPQIVDVTPQLDKAFSPTTISQGQTSTLTFTVTNTSDLAAKNGWNFVDQLPLGLTVSSALGGTCQRTASSAAGRTISVTGNLAAGATSCTITVGVTSTTPGNYRNSGCATDGTGAPVPNCTNNFTTITGLYPPLTAPLTVLPVVGLSITKTADIANHTPGQPITYTVIVRNAGPSDAVNASFADPLPASITGASWTCAVTTPGTANLPPTGPTSCAASGSGAVSDTVRVNAGGVITYTITGTVRAGTTGSIVNTATVTPAATTAVPNRPGGGPDPTPGSTTNVITVDPGCPPAPGAGCSAAVTTRGASIALEKSAGAIVDANADGVVGNVGDTIPFRFLVTNNGQTTLTGAGVTDDMVGPVTCAPTTLVPAATANCGPVDHAITQADVDAGSVDNVATAFGAPPNGPPRVSPPDDTSTPLPSEPALALDKTAGDIADANGDGIAGNAGDVIPFSFVLTNTGLVTLTDLSVDDDMVGPVTCTPTSLAPGASASCGPVDYVITQADVDAGSVENVATGEGTPPTGPPTVTPPDDTSTPVPQVPGLVLDKSAGDIVDTNDNGIVGDPGDTILFSFTLTNTGDVTLTDVSVDDDMVGPVTCDPTSLAPGGSASCGPVDYVITQADVDAGSVENVATGEGTPPTGPPTVTPPDDTSTPLPQDPALTLDKSAGAIVDSNSDGVVGNAGDTIPFSFVLTNTGLMTLTDVSVDDDMVGPVTCNPTSLAPGASTSCGSVGYVITQADVDAGSVENVATGEGTPPTGPPTVTPPDDTSTPLPQDPGLVLDKSAGAIVDTNDNDVVGDPGDTIPFSFTLTNTGLVTLTDLSVDDDMVGPVTCTPTSLAPGASASCGPVGYVVTQADVDAGSVENVATGEGTPPTGPPTVTPPDDTSTPLPQDPGLVLDKSAGAIVDTNDNDVVGDPGDVIPFSFVLTNTGLVTLTDVAVDDDMVGPVTCAPTSLAPGASASCGPVGYVITQADIDAGSVENVATGEGTPPTGPPTVTPPDDTSTPLPQDPALTLDKIAGDIVDANRDGIVGNAGDTIDYRFEVTNTGNITLDRIRIDDPKISVACPTGVLAPGASTTCGPVTYSIVRAEASAGKVVNTATAAGDPPDGPPVESPPSSVTVPIERTGVVTDEDPRRPSRRTGFLPRTGASALGLALVGGVLVAAGAVLVGGRRRRRAVR